MKTLEDIFSTKEQRELLEKYEEACYQQFKAACDMTHLSEALISTLPIRCGVWFKYGYHSGVIKRVDLHNDLEVMDIRYNPNGLEDEYRYSLDDEWLTINLPEDYDKIQIIPEDECSDRHPDSDRHID